MLSNDGRHDLAIKDYNRALQLNPDYSNVYNKSGVAYLLKRQRDKAISDFRKGLKISPLHESAKVNLNLLGMTL